jgi:hypothetical protein
MPPGGSTLPSLRSAQQHTPAFPITSGAAVCDAGGRQGSKGKSGDGNYSKITADARRTEVEAKCFTAKGAKSAKIV